MRTGPASIYDIKYIYIKRNSVFKILDIYDEWYKVVDIDGEEGWIKQNLFFHSKKFQYCMMLKDNTACYKKPNENSKIALVSDSLVIFQIKKCTDSWCKIQNDGISGWCKKENLWGGHFYHRVSS